MIMRKKAVNKKPSGESFLLVEDREVEPLTSLKLKITE